MEEADLSVKRGCSADLATYWLGLKRTFDPRGRSTRTELWMLLVLPTVAGFGLLLSGDLLGVVSFEGRLRSIIVAAIVLPLPAAATRRCHDMGKTGWLGIPALTIAAITMWNAWLSVANDGLIDRDLWYNRRSEETIFRIAAAAYWLFLMLPPQTGPNAFGSDPRPSEKPL